MEELEKFSGLIETMYDAAAGNSSFWPLGEKIAAEFGSQNGGLQVRRLSTGLNDIVTATESCTVETFRRYNQYYHKIDILANQALTRPMGVMLRSEELVSDVEFRRSEFYQDHCRPQRIFHSIGVVIPIGGPEHTLAGLRLNRAENAAGFDTRSLYIGTLLLPHLKRALQLKERLAQLEIQEQSMAQATATLDVGVLVVTAEGVVVFANPAAEAKLLHKNGILIQNNVLQATSPSLDDKLRRTIRNAAGASIGRAQNGGGLVRIPRGHGKPIGLSIYPFMGPVGAVTNASPMALIFIADPNASSPPKKEVLAEVYGLTPAEARLFAALLAGERLQDHADRFAISIQTVKTQLAHIFKKRPAIPARRISSVMRSATPYCEWVGRSSQPHLIFGAILSLVRVIDGGMQLSQN